MALWMWVTWLVERIRGCCGWRLWRKCALVQVWWMHELCPRVECLYTRGLWCTWHVYLWTESWMACGCMRCAYITSLLATPRPACVHSRARDLQPKSLGVVAQLFSLAVRRTRGRRHAPTEHLRHLVPGRGAEWLREVLAGGEGKRLRFTIVELV